MRAMRLGHRSSCQPIGVKRLWRKLELSASWEGRIRISRMAMALLLNTGLVDLATCLCELFISTNLANQALEMREPNGM